MARRAPLQRFVGARNELRTRLGQHLDGDVVGNQVLLDDFAHEVEIGLRRGRKSHLDFLEADLHQHVEHAALARRIHRFDQRLIAVAQIDAAPDRRRLNDAVRPGAVGEVDRGKGSILVEGIRNIKILSLSIPSAMQRLNFRQCSF